MAINAVLIGKGATSSNTVSTASAASTGGANSVFVIVVSYDAGVSITSVSDNKGNTYTQVGTPQGAAGGLIAFYECVGGTGGSGHVATVDFSGTAYPVAHLIEVTGAASSSPRDVNVGSSGAYADDISLTSGTLAQANEVLIAAISTTNGGTRDYQETSAYGFTVLSQETDGNNYWTSGVLAKVVSATTSVAATFDDEAGSTVADWQGRLVSYKEAAAGGSYTLAMGQGSYTNTGQTVGLKAARKLAAAQGSYSVNGQTVGLTYSGAGPKTLTVEQGSYLLTGQTSALRVGRGLVAAQGSYAKTGQTVSLRGGRVLMLAQGSYALAGSDALVDYAITMAQGGYALTGQAVALRATRKLTAAYGTYTHSGVAVGLNYSAAPPVVRKYNLPLLGAGD